MEVRWDEPKVRARYEPLVSVLISWLYPDAQRIDGSGGDGGRDVLVPTDDGLLIFELKSFTGRISSGGRKAQITRSLARAAEHSPVAWRLIVPIDPTPSELAWFERVTAPYPFECIWHGRTWLDSELARRPGIVRYFLEDYEVEVLRLLKDLKDEEGNVGNAFAAIHRARAIRQRLTISTPTTNMPSRLVLARAAEPEAPSSLCTSVTTASMSYPGSLRPLGTAPSPST